MADFVGRVHSGSEVTALVHVQYLTVNNIVLGSTSFIYDYMTVITVSDRACTIEE
jgi:hypothetical protein